MRDLFKLLIAIFRCQAGWTQEMAPTGIAEIDAVIPEFFAKGIFEDGSRDSFWGPLTGGEGSRMPIIMKTGPLKNAGDQITFSTIAQLMGAGISGDSAAGNVLKGNEELVSVGTFTVTATLIRHAVGVTRLANKQANYNQVKVVQGLLKDWMGRKQDHDTFDAFLDSSTIETLYAGVGNTAVGHLSESDADYFGPAELEMLRMALIRQGAVPLKVSKINGRNVPVYGCVYSEIDEYWLNTNSVFVQTCREAWDRFRGENKHPIFNSAVSIYRNLLLFPYYSALSIPQGTPLRPETIVSTTLVTAETDTLYVGGPSITTGVTPSYTEYFASSGSLQIGDEIISYTGKTVNTFTGLTRGVSSTTAAQHAVNALVTQRNISTVIGFGAEAVFKAMPESPEAIGEKDDYGEQIGLGVRGYYGQKLKIDTRRGKAVNAVLMKCYSENPGTV